MAFVEKNKKKLKKTLGPTSREKANLEAEKGETVLTNLSPTDNIYELKLISGKKHSKGGTPLNLPTGEGDGKSASFIFSDNKQLSIKDKEQLSFFGVTGEKSLTPAAISRKHLDAVAKSKAIIKDIYADKISKASGKKNLDNSRFALSALALLQESKKNFKDGPADVFEAFYNKTKTTPEDIFSIKEGAEEEIGQEVKKAFGGSTGVKKYKVSSILPKADLGNLPVYKGTDDELKRYFKDNKGLASQYEYIKELGTNEDFVNKLYAEYEKSWEDKGVQSTKFYNNRNDKNSTYKKLSKEKVFESFLNSQKRNLALQAHKIDYNQIGDAPSQNNTSAYLNKYISENLGDEFNIPDAVGTAQEQLAYTAFNNLVTSNDAAGAESKLKVLAPFEAQKLGISDDTYGGKKGSNISRADGVYTNTTAGHNAYFKPAVVEAAAAGNKPGAATEDTYDAGKVKHLENVNNGQNPFGFRREDLQSLQRANQAKNEILRLQPWQKSADTQMTEPMFSSPERAIAAINEQVNQAGNVASSFGTAAASAAQMASVQGKAYEQVANTIGQYDDKNVGIFNSANQSNTQLANLRSAQEAQDATSMHDKRTVLKQQFANSMGAAKDKITQLSNQAWTNASNIYNLNTTTEQFKKDPFTGLITKTGDKALDPTAKSATEGASSFNAFYKEMPKGTTIKDAVQVWKVSMGVADKNEYAQPDDQQVPLSEQSFGGVAKKKYRIIN